MTTKLIALTESEMRIWEAAYGAAFAIGVRDNRRIGMEMFRALRGDADWAEATAASAVLRLRKLREEGNSAHPKDVRGAPPLLEVDDEDEESST